MQRIYIGVDFHARQQTICYLITETGELVTSELKHQDKEAVRAFYAAFRGQVIVGLEASGYSPWFEQLLEELGYEVWLGHATEIRRRARWRQKNDRRDAELILDLMLHNEFPRLHRPALQSREVMRMLRYRHKLIKLRTMSKNSLQALGCKLGSLSAVTCLAARANKNWRRRSCHRRCSGNESTGCNCCSHSINKCWKRWPG